MAGDLIGTATSDNFGTDGTSVDDTEAEFSGAIDDETLSNRSGNLTDRRVGSNTRKPPQAESDGTSDGDTLDDDAAENISSSIIDNTDNLLNTEPGREVLANDIDGNTPETRDDGETVAIEGTLDQLDEEETLDIEVAVVSADGDPDTFVTDDGTVVYGNLHDGQNSAIVTDSAGNDVLLLADDLTVEEVVDETSDALTDVIGTVAEENGVEVDYESLRAGIHQRALEIAESYFQEVYVPVRGLELALDDLNDYSQGLTSTVVQPQSPPTDAKLIKTLVS